MANSLEALDSFTPERWEAARRVLSGEEGDRVSWAAAARAAGVAVRELRGWVRRSQECHPEDDPLIHSIAELVEGIQELQANRLEDEAWRRAIEGEETPIVYKGEITGSYNKVDNKLLMSMLSVRDPRYSSKKEVNIRIEDVNEIFRRLQAGKRLMETQAEAREQEIIDADFTEV